MRKILIGEKIYYIGVNDRKKHLFENNWPLPMGVSYNSYLIADVKSALIDTLEFGAKDGYLDEIESILQCRQLDYLIINHMEPDHSSMIGIIHKKYPKIKIVAGSKAVKMLDSYYGIGKDSIHEVKDGDSIELGFHKLKFIMTPWIHWPETMMTYNTVEKVLFSCDAFGSFGTLDGGIFDYEIDFSLYMDEMRRYYSNIVGKYSNMVQKAFEKLKGMEIKCICPSHGPIWKKDPAKPVALYDKWSRHQADKGLVIAYASMYGHTEKMADYLARLVAENGIRNIRIFDVSKTHVSFILSEIWKYEALVLGSCAYNSGMHPMMRHLCDELEVVNPKNKNYALFGSYSWSGGGLKSLQEWAKKMEWNMVAQPVEIQGEPAENLMKGFFEIAEKIL